MLFATARLSGARNGKKFGTKLSIAQSVADRLPELAILRIFKKRNRRGKIQLREILFNWKPRHPILEGETWIVLKSSRAYLSIAKAAQRYCCRCWNANVDDVV